MSLHDWLNPYHVMGDAAQELDLSNSGGIGSLGGSRSSDNNQPSPTMDTIGQAAFGVQNSGTGDKPRYVYARYTEAWKMPSTMAKQGSAQGDEVSVNNVAHDSPSASPYNPNPPGLTEGHRVGANTALEDKFQGFSISTAYQVVSRGKPGDVFGIGYSVAFNALDGNGYAYNLARGHKIQFWRPNDTPGPHMRSDVTEAGMGLNIILFDGGIAFQDAKRVNRMIIDLAGDLILTGKVRTS